MLSNNEGLIRKLIIMYNNPHGHGPSAAKSADLYEWSSNGKLITISECGTMPDPDLIVRDNAY